MPILSIDPEAPDAGALHRAAAILRGGGLVAFPTETVYGLGGNALDEDAVRRIFAAKGRPAFNPLIAHVPDLESARDLADSWPDLAETAGRAFWPGPLTLVVAKRDDIPDVVTAGLPSVALRVPSHPVAHRLLQLAGIPLAAPSANRYTELSPTTARHVEKSLGDRLDLILDGGPTEVGIESTVLDVSGARPLLLRPGAISLADLERALGPVSTAVRIDGEAARPSPGMVRKHYAPRARFAVYPAERRAEMEERAGDASRRGERVGALLRSPMATAVAEAILMPGDPAGYARQLYAALHRLDDAGCQLIVADAVPDAPEWAGVRDRMLRAMG